MLALSKNNILQRSAEEGQKEISQRTVIFRRDTKKTFISALQSKNAVREIMRLPDFEESMHIIARGNFPLFSIIPAVLKLEHPAIIKNLHIATLGFSKTNATDLFDMMDAKSVGNVSLIASVFFERQSPSEWQIMKDGLVSRGQRLIALRAHAKIIAIEMSDGRRFVVESSANLRSCHNIEQIAIFQSPPLYDFHAGWINEAIKAGSAKDG